MTPECHHGRVPGDVAAALDDGRRALFDGFAQLDTTLVPVHARTQHAAGIEIVHRRRAHWIAGHGDIERRALQAGERLAHVEAEAWRRATSSGSGTPPARRHAGVALLAHDAEHVLHHAASDRPVLFVRRDDRTDARNRAGMMQEVAPDHVPVALGDDRVHVFADKHRRHHRLGKLHRRPVGRKPVLLRDRLERLVADAPARLAVGRSSGAQLQRHGRPAEPTLFRRRARP